MTPATDSDFQRLVLERLDKIDHDIAGLKQDTRDTNTKFDAYVKASEKIERLATTIIITAGTVTLLAPVLQAIAPTIRAFLGGAA
ncbi:hypothetical protein GS597_02190 [Synechococcales cyanobacterium C]|uniref:Uncharacterized protein n=1 Tax=Petrachloros mirabilis ULC683 TaxID=2781853 RepID=A0A8K1ZWD1_9CYAN|nr:hypothetical protein [Petrachloros mirabilis]NCJ05341.1 hypothetical protein [Petrachloros mirabilis ULC683]